MSKSLSSFLLILSISVFTTAKSQTTAEEYYNAAVTLEDDNKIDEAITSFKKAVSLNANYTDALYELGWCYNEQGKYSDAMPVLKKATQGSSAAKVYFELGYAQQYSK